MKNSKAISTLILMMFLLLGLTLGTSITTFILFLNKSDNLLAIISYLFLAIFCLLVIVFMYLMNKTKNITFKQETKEENGNEEQNK